MQVMKSGIQTLIDLVLDGSRVDKRNRRIATIIKAGITRNA
jgi:hypothetical protein